MNTQDSRYREDFSKAIFVTGSIDDSLVRELAPKIIELRSSNKDPITVYINSNGGFPAAGDAILSALKAPDADGRITNIVTVVTGYANSTAADLLIYGDYAIAYPDASIHCHGARIYTNEEELTMERARVTGASLWKLNETIALHLYKHVIHRLIFVYLNLKPQFDAIRQSHPGKDDVECFAQTLLSQPNISYDALKVMNKALEHYRKIQKVSDYVWKRVNLKGAKLYLIHAKILREIINFHLIGKRNSTFSLPIDDISEHLNLIKEYVTGEYTNFVNPLIRRWGKFFLIDEEPAVYEKLPEDKKFDWLSTKTKPRVQPLLYFAFSLCRLLQEQENRLTAIDAYWLGIVDEVMGSEFPCLRSIAENPPPDANQAQVKQ